MLRRWNMHKRERHKYNVILPIKMTKVCPWAKKGKNILYHEGVQSWQPHQKPQPQIITLKALEKT